MIRNSLLAHLTFTLMYLVCMVVGANVIRQGFVQENTSIALFGILLTCVSVLGIFGEWWDNETQDEDKINGMNDFEES